MYVKIIDYLKIPCINVGADKIRKTKSIYEVEDLKGAYLTKDLGESLVIQDKVWNEILSQ